MAGMHVRLKPSVTVQESQAVVAIGCFGGQVVGALRRVVLTRPLKGASADYYTFNPLEPWPSAWP